MKGSLLLLIALGLVGSSLVWASKPSSVPYFEAEDMTPFWPNEDQKLKAHTLAHVSSFSVVDQNGKLASERAMKGRISVVNFFFAECGSACPLMMHALQQFQKRIHKEGLDRNVDFYSFSVLPKQDTPKALMLYAKARHMDLENWRLLTGAQKEIFRVGKQMFKADRSVGGRKQSADSFLHSQSVWVVDANLNIRGIYDSVDANQMKNLEEDIAKLSDETKR